MEKTYKNLKVFIFFKNKIIFLKKIGTQMINIKIEYSFYLKKKYYDLIAKLQEFYNEEEKLIQVNYDSLNLDND